MTGVRRTTASVVASVRSVTRDPFGLASLLLLPPVSVALYGASVGSIADLGLFDTVASLRTVGEVTGAVFAASALAGILGLFQSQATRPADRRLVVAGYRRGELVAARFATVGLTALVVALVTTAALELVAGGRVAAPVPAAGALFLAAASFGLVGVLVGSVLSRQLEGSLVLVALADLGAIVASGLFGIDGDLARLLPLTRLHDVVLRAVVGGAVAWSDVLPAVGRLLAVALLAAVAVAGGLPATGDAA